MLFGLIMVEGARPWTALSRLRLSVGDHGLATSPLEPGRSITTTAEGMLARGDHVTCKITEVTRTLR